MTKSMEDGSEGRQVAFAPKRNGRSQDFDLEMGAKLRAIRIFIGVSQAELGTAIGVSSQQIQNYEIGKNRIAAGTLQDIGNGLGVHPALFFLDMPIPAGDIAELRNAMRMAAKVKRIPSFSDRRQLLTKVYKISQNSLPGKT